MMRQILIVDDEAAITLTLKAILEMYGFSVDTASSGQAAIAKLDRNTYDMVITDMKMEHDRAGYDVVRAANKTGHPPAVAILTAFPSSGEDWQREGAKCLLVKPMNTSELVRKIELLLSEHENGRQRREAVESRPAGGAKVREALRRSGHEKPLRRSTTAKRIH